MVATSTDDAFSLIVILASSNFAKASYDKGLNEGNMLNFRKGRGKVVIFPQFGAKIPEN